MENNIFPPHLVDALLNACENEEILSQEFYDEAAELCKVHGIGKFWDILEGFCDNDERFINLDIIGSAVMDYIVEFGLKTSWDKVWETPEWKAWEASRA